jgi:Rrf2 family protein
MTTMLHISEAASLALHTAAFLAAHHDRLVSTHEIAQTLGVSENHLAKVRQRLSKAGLVDATRGPHGGFRLAKPAEVITLLDIYEAVEGPIRPTSCLLGRHEPCDPSNCIFRGLADSVNRQVLDYFKSVTLAQFRAKPEVPA